MINGWHGNKKNQSTQQLIEQPNVKTYLDQREHLSRRLRLWSNYL